MCVGKLPAVGMLVRTGENCCREDSLRPLLTALAHLLTSRGGNDETFEEGYLARANNVFSNGLSIAYCCCEASPCIRRFIFFFFFCARDLRTLGNDYLTGVGGFVAADRRMPHMSPYDSKLLKFTSLLVPIQRSNVVFEHPLIQAVELSHG